jgi:3',5'-cyclic AMP phosphodiesterase CpdA
VSIPVAILADAHVHDIHGDYDAAGVILNGRRATLRSWHDTARSARAFNESGMAFDAALDSIRARGIRHVVLLGDYTDDGQVETTDRLAARLHAAHDLSFYAIPGNHDVFGPFGKHTATRFRTETGTQLVTSDPTLAAEERHAAVLSPKLRCMGQPMGLSPMAAFGLFRQPHYLHWESPFGLSDAVADRQYDARSADGRTTRRLMDASYLVEPEAGLWLLMIDANIFEPRDGDWNERQKRAFLDPSTAGWTALLRVKPFLLPWIASVTARAKAQGKGLLTLSHYPALDPYEDAGDLERTLFGETETARRRPAPPVAAALAGAGVTLHFSGHIHSAGTVSVESPAGQLTNVAVPSLVSWPPGFVIARATPQGPDVETVRLTPLPLDPALIALYRAESDDSPEMLGAPDYTHFLLAQSRRRAIHRVLPRDWPRAIAVAVPTATALDLATLMEGAPSLTPDPAREPAVAARAARLGFDAGTLADYPMSDFVADWYALRQAGPLGRDALTPDRLAACRFLSGYGSAAPQAHSPDAAFFARILAVLATSLARMDRD